MLEFVVIECGRGAAVNAQRVVSRLRSLLRFLFFDGMTATDLAVVLPAAADRHAGRLPQTVTTGDVARLLRACDRRRAVGRRDYAIVVVLARLGLRAGEVARLQLDDIDWRNGEIVVHGKGGRTFRLPLPVDVGDAIAAWLRRGRPRCESRYVFLRSRAPLGPLSTGGVSRVIARACERAGLAVFHAHRLRHSVASEILRAGGSLVEAGIVLHHDRQSTTAVYAKVDRRGMSVVVAPWPGSPR